MATYAELAEAAYAAGAINIDLVVSSIKLAVSKGDSIDSTLAIVRKHRPELFKSPAERKASARAEALRNWRPK